MLGVLGFGFSAWAVFLGGLSATHFELASANDIIVVFDTFSFSWFLACGFLLLWLAIMVSWRWGVMSTVSRVLTPIIAIFLAWYGIKVQDLLKLLLIVRSALCSCTPLCSSVTATVPAAHPAWIFPTTRVCRHTRGIL
jgi:hypothetical protein